MHRHLRLLSCPSKDRSGLSIRFFQTKIKHMAPYAGGTSESKASNMGYAASLFPLGTKPKFAVFLRPVCLFSCFGSANASFLQHFIISLTCMPRTFVLECVWSIGWPLWFLAIAHTGAKTKQEVGNVPVSVLYQMLVCGYIMHGFPLSALKQDELFLFHRHLLGNVPSTETLFEQYAVPMERKIIRYVRLALKHGCRMGI